MKVPVVADVAAGIDKTIEERKKKTQREFVVIYFYLL